MGGSSGSRSLLNLLECSESFLSEPASLRLANISIAWHGKNNKAREVLKHWQRRCNPFPKVSLFSVTTFESICGSSLTLGWSSVILRPLVYLHVDWSACAVLELFFVARVKFPFGPSIYTMPFYRYWEKQETSGELSNNLRNKLWYNDEHLWTHLNDCENRWLVQDCFSWENRLRIDMQQNVR
jgi:hypothetical protein